MGAYYCHICGTYGDSDDGCEEYEGNTCHEDCLEEQEEIDKEEEELLEVDHGENKKECPEQDFIYPKRSSKKAKDENVGQEKDWDNIREDEPNRDTKEGDKE